MDNEPLKLKFSGALVEQLGAQLYPSATATVAELISNAWDADAHNVWVTIPFGQSWTEGDEIVVLDDGHGMTRAQAQSRFLIVGRKRRLQDGGKSPGGRDVHGRKGIGKLAAFGTAEVLDCVTVRGSNQCHFDRTTTKSENHRLVPTARSMTLQNRVRSNATPRDALGEFSRVYLTSHPDVRVADQLVAKQLKHPRPRLECGLHSPGDELQVGLLWRRLETIVHIQLRCDSAQPPTLSSVQ